MTVSQVEVICYYHDAHKAELLHEAVFPVVKMLQNLGFAAHAERHWLHGPHVRICLRGEAPDIGTAAHLAVEMLRSHLTRRPALTTVDDATLLERSVAAGLAELVPGPYTPLYPNNTVRIEHGERIHLRRLLGSAAVARRAEMLVAGLAPAAATVADLIGAGNTPHRRVRWAIAVMAIHAAHYPAGFAAGYQSFQSHLEDFLHLGDRGGTLRATFAANWRRHGDTVTAQVARLVGSDFTHPAEIAWYEWETAAWRIGRQAHQAGELPLIPGSQYAELARATGDPATAQRWDLSKRVDFSAYHQQLRQLDFFSLPGIAEDFPPYRFATNVLYLLLALCDLTPVERYLAASLFGEAVQRLTGTKWEAALASHLAAGNA